MTERPAWIAKELNALTWDVLRPVVFAGVGVGLILLATCNMAQSAPITCDQRGCSDWKVGRATAGQPHHGRSHTRRRAVDGNGNAVVIGGRPAGCPRRFCGCFASLEVFGTIKPHLNLAKNWLQFPRTSPAPGMVAARPGHVFVLMSHVEGNEWLVKDGNSGGGLTRQHVRSISGFRIVNPHGSYAAR